MLEPIRNASSAAKRIAAIAAALAVILGAIVVLTGDDGGEQVTAAADDTSTTTEPSTTSTSTTAPTTTAAPTTTPPTTAAPAPPPTAAPPPPGSFEMPAVLAYAKSHYGGTPIFTTTGGNSCPAGIERPDDAGDDTNRDIGEWHLIRYCDDTYRVVMATDEDSSLEAAWARFDTASGGCEGTDRVVLGWWGPRADGGATPFGAVVATPSCDASSWTYVDAAGYPLYNGGWIQLDFRGSAIGSPSTFEWRGYVKGVGDSTVDVVPNAGPEHFVV